MIRPCLLPVKQVARQPAGNRTAPPTMTVRPGWLEAIPAPSLRSEVGWVYTLHFDQPIGDTSNRYGYAQHYTGWAVDLDARLATHTAGNGARLLEVVSARGIGWRIACLERGTRDRERQLKARGAARRCPICCSERRRRELEEALIWLPTSHQDVVDELELGDGAYWNWGVTWTLTPDGRWVNPVAAGQAAPPSLVLLDDPRGR
jgi:predicted GIY-YIG superfamily endonuclease